MNASSNHHEIVSKNGWRRVKFGDVVRFVKEDADPDSGEFERYVAGEHIETDNLHIRKWGTFGDGYLGPAFHRRFKKGQVLYGSRRTATGKTIEWRLWAQDPTLNWAESERGFARANERVVADWLTAVRQDRQPVCSGCAGMRALEMAMAVFAAGLARGRVVFPLKNRQHPLIGSR